MTLPIERDETPDLSRLLASLEEILKTEPRTELRKEARRRYLELTDPERRAA